MTPIEKLMDKHFKEARAEGVKRWGDKFDPYTHLPDGQSMIVGVPHLSKPRRRVKAIMKRV